jgi:hypothetical protein
MVIALLKKIIRIHIISKPFYMRNTTKAIEKFNKSSDLAAPLFTRKGPAAVRTVFSTKPGTSGGVKRKHG